MDKLTLLREWCQTKALAAALILTFCTRVLQSPSYAETPPSPTVTTIVKEIRQVPGREGVHYVAYLYDARDDRVLPIWISPNQAFSIATVLDERPFPRPLTHDLMSALLKETRTTLEQIVVDTLRPMTDDRSGGTYFATLTLRLPDGHQTELDARPSDAMALAVRLDLDIEVSRTIMDHNSLVEGHTPTTPEPAEEDPYY